MECEQHDIQIGTRARLHFMSFCFFSFSLFSFCKHACFCCTFTPVRTTFQTTERLTTQNSTKKQKLNLMQKKNSPKIEEKIAWNFGSFVEQNVRCFDARLTLECVNCVPTESARKKSIIYCNLFAFEWYVRECRRVWRGAIDWLASVTGDWHKWFYKFRRTQCTVRRYATHTRQASTTIEMRLLQIGSAIISSIDVTIWCDNDSGERCRAKEKTKITE